MPRIFISYATHDLNYAATLYSGLAMRNIDLWFAPVCIKSGENFVEQIANALKDIEDEDDKVRSAENCKSCDIFIFLLSKYSMDSTWIIILILILCNCGCKVDPCLLIIILLILCGCGGGKKDNCGC